MLVKDEHKNFTHSCFATKKYRFLEYACQRFVCVEVTERRLFEIKILVCVLNLKQCYASLFQRMLWTVINKLTAVFIT